MPHLNAECAISLEVVCCQRREKENYKKEEVANDLGFGLDELGWGLWVGWVV